MANDIQIIPRDFNLLYLGQKGYNEIRLNNIAERCELLGRANEMNELSNRFCHPDRPPAGEKLILLGPPGVGKSALFTNCYRENRDQHVVLIQRMTEE